MTLNNQRDYGTESTIFQTEVDDTRRRELGMWSGDLLLVGDAESVHLSTHGVSRALTRGAVGTGGEVGKGGRVIATEYCNNMQSI